MAPTRRSFAGFTLIELLVVIAIIAILTAILLPVFASVRENSRQSVVISNLKDISQKMEQYKLDNHKYPDVLFGYAAPGTTMKNGLAMAQAYDAANPGANHAAAYFSGLYPAYIKDPDEFTDPNNSADVNSPPATQIAGPLNVNLVAPCNPTSDEAASGAGTSNCTGAVAGAVVKTTRNFYVMDAYDSNPPIIGGNKVDNTLANYVPRYQLAREGTICPGLFCDGSVAANDPDYKRQLRWKNPPSDAVVTLTSYHVQNADKVLLLFQSGAVKKIKAEDFLGNVIFQGNATGPMTTDNAANSWRYKQ
jgi:prepilin-type N-terminal cleavage/methylation domain-containing protein